MSLPAGTAAITPPAPEAIKNHPICEEVMPARDARSLIQGPRMLRKSPLQKAERTVIVTRKQAGLRTRLRRVSGLVNSSFESDIIVLIV